MVTLYLLPYSNYEICYSFNKSQLEHLIKTERFLTSPSILSVDIDDSLVENLKESSDLSKISKPYPYEIPNSYYEKTKEFLKNPPDWFKEDGMRIYIIFDKRKRCFWCPSGNNINYIYKLNPQYYLSKAIRVNLDQKSYIQLYSYFEFMCDSF
jgi:hypothetical protein